MGHVSSRPEHGSWAVGLAAGDLALWGKGGVRTCPRLFLKPLTGRRADRGFADEFPGRCSFVMDFLWRKIRTLNYRGSSRGWCCLVELLRNFCCLIKWPFVLRRSIKPLLEVRSLRWVSCVRGLEIQGSIQSISHQKRHQEDGLAPTLHIAGQSAHDRSKKGQRYKQKIGSCSFLWNGPDLR